MDPHLDAGLDTAPSPARLSELASRSPPDGPPIRRAVGSPAPTLDRESYRRDPGRASALAYWKARELDGPAGPVVLHASADDGRYGGAPRRYFKLVRDLAQVRPAVAPHGITLRPVSPAAAHEISALIAACYDDIRATPGEVRSWGSRSVHDPGLWVGAFQDEDLVGCAIADSEAAPERLYRACGFTGDDVWHVYGRT